jgi:hypothetical protein
MRTIADFGVLHFEWMKRVQRDTGLNPATESSIKFPPIEMTHAEFSALSSHYGRFNQPTTLFGHEISLVETPSGTL